MTHSSIARREVLVGAVGVGASLITTLAAAQPKNPPPAPAAPKGAASPIKPVAPPSPALQAIVDSTAHCQRDGRVCLARCTDHLAAGSPMMDQCQRAVMNMLAVTSAMAEVAGYRNADPKNIKLLTSACAEFCRACAKACEPHAGHHEECKACMDACVACAKACDTYSA